MNTEDNDNRQEKKNSNKYFSKKNRKRNKVYKDSEEKLSSELRRTFKTRKNRINSDYSSLDDWEEYENG